MKVYEGSLPSYKSVDDVIAQNPWKYDLIKELFDKSPDLKQHAEHLFSLTESEEALRANGMLVKDLMMKVLGTVGVPLGEGADPRMQTAAIMACLVPLMAAVKVMTLTLNGAVREAKQDLSTALIATETADIIAENVSVKFCARMDAIHDKRVLKTNQTPGNA